MTKVRNEQPAQKEKEAGEPKIEIRYIKLGDIEVGTRLRAVDGKTVGGIGQSVADIGLQVPIKVQRVADVGRTSGLAGNRGGQNDAGLKPWILVSGAHRLEAAKQARLKKVPCIVSMGTDADRELGEITENLFRKELTALERADQIVRYLSLTNREDVLAQNAPKSWGRPQGGMRAAARALGFDRAVIARAVKIASISKEARAAIIKENFDNHQAKLLKIAAERTPTKQLAKVGELTRPKPSRQKQGARSLKAMAGDESEKTGPAAGRSGSTRTIELALAHLLAERLGSATGHFLSLISELGSEDLRRLGVAVQQRAEIVAVHTGKRSGPSRKKVKTYIGENLKF